MAHFARLDENNTVVSVHCINNSNTGNLPFPESESVGVAFLTAVHGAGKTWKQCSFNSNFRGHYPGKGEQYDAGYDLFIAVRPMHLPSYVLDTATGYWVPPVPYPSDGRHYAWNEQLVQWDYVADSIPAL
ncbi:MAG: hypothetical protein HQM04_10240 [Magnetococcales bacterium]|nr:hypothetical protein [Magnetococcales bacterium]MBF0115410.1 hypothetical protein [Magnetococcales bacterium]